MSRIDKFALAKQTGFGTKQTVAEYFPPIEVAEPEHQREPMEVEENLGNPFPTAIDYGVEFFKLGISGAPRLSSFPRLLSMWYGAPVTTTPDGVGAPTARNHAFSMANAPVPHSLYVVRKDPSPAIVDLFWDAIGDDFTLNVAANAFLKFQGNAIAKELDDTQADPSSTLDTSSRMTFDQCKAYISVDGGGESEIKVSGFTLTTGNAVDTDEAILGSRRLFALKEGNRRAEVTFMPRETLSTHYRRALQSDPAKVKIRLEALGAIIGAAVKYKIAATVYACEYISAPAPVRAGDRLKQLEVKARARYDESVSKFVELDVVNTVASY